MLPTIKGQFEGNFRQFLLTKLLTSSDNSLSDINFSEITEISLENIWSLKQVPSRSRLNLRLDSIYQQINEVRALGNSTVIVDLTLRSGRNLGGLLDLAESYSVIHIVCSTCPLSAHPKFSPTDSLSFEKFMLKEIMEGVSLIRIQNGAEIAVVVKAGAASFEITENHHDTGTEFNFLGDDLVCLHALGQLHKSLPVPLIIRSSFCFTNHSKILEVLQQANAKQNHVIFCGIRCSISNKPYIISLLENSSCLLCFDEFGNILQPIDSPIPPHDDEIVEVIHDLCKLGYVDRLILSIMISYKIQLSQYGGPGYAHLQNTIYHKLTRRGLSEDYVIKLTCKNAERLFCWYTPPSPVEIPPETLNCYWCNTKFVPGDHFTKFSFFYCSSNCLSSHRKMGWKEK